MKIPSFKDIKYLFTEKKYYLPFGFSNLFTYTERRGLDAYTGWVYACVNARAEEVANIRLHLYQNGKEIENHPALDLLHNVNDYMSFYDLVNATQAYLDLTGDAFWALLKGNISGQIREIQVLRPDLVTIVSSPENPVVKYQYTNGSETLEFLPEEIIHFKNFNPKDPLRGMSVIEAARTAVNTDNFAARWNENFFKNNAMPDFVMTIKGGVTEEDFQRFTQQWRQKYSSTDNAHKTAMLRLGENGDIDIKDLTKVQKDIEFLEQRKYSRDEILAMFRVPKTIIGITEDVNYASAEASRMVFMQRTVKPLMQKFINTLNEFYLPLFDKSRGLEFDFDDPVPEDRAAKINEYVAGVDKWITRNEIREELGLPPVKGGDKLWNTLTAIPIDSTVQAPEEEAPEEEGGEGKKIKSSLDKFEEIGEKHNKALRLISDKYQNKIKRAVRKYFRQQKERVLNKFKSKSIKASIPFNDKEEIKLLIDIVLPIFRDLVETEGTQALAMLGLAEDFKITPDIEKVIEKDSLKFASQVNQTTRDALKETIKEGMENGESIDKLTERISNVYEDISERRAEMIARTESTRFANEADVLAWKEAGVERKIWYCALDERTCDDCMALHGEVVSIDSKFFDDDYGSGEQPPLHTDCRCSLVPG